MSQQPAQHETAEGVSPQEDATPDIAAENSEENPSPSHEELEAERQRADENWNRYLEALAESDNLRKRSERDLQNAHKFALERFVNELLPVFDSLEMGIAAARESGESGQLLEGVELTQRQFENALQKFGVEALDPQGEKFNPEHHEAMAMQPSSEQSANTVLQVIQKGYLLNQRLVRPARVIVARAAD